MTWYDWLIMIVPILAVFYIGCRTKQYVRGVADFLVAGRLCGKYVLCMGDIANAIAIITLLAFVETHYKTGFALAFWNGVMAPLSIIISLTGYCIYRFRETKAMSLGQFLEMRYNRSFRIFAAALRSVSEVTANMIMPALAARFFIYFLDLPQKIEIGGITISVFTLIVLLTLIMAISLIWMGGTLALVVTDAIQGMFCYPLLVVLTIFIFCKFSWWQEIMPTMMDRVSGESFINPYDIDNLRDFNLFSLLVVLLGLFLHTVSWTGSGASSAAKSAQEQKIGGLFGRFRGAMGGMFYLLVAAAMIVMMNHPHFGEQSRTIRNDLTRRISDEVLADHVLLQSRVVAEAVAQPPIIHRIGVDKPLSEQNNPDQIYLGRVHKTLSDSLSAAESNSIFQEFRTLYYQMMMALGMRQLLPPVLMGLFALLMVLIMLSTDDSRIFSSAITITQDVVMPLLKKPLAPKRHIQIVRWVAVGVGICFFCGSSFMAQLDYINLFVTIVCTMWLGGCGPVLIFGLYSRFGTTAGAFTSLVAGMLLSFAGIAIQQGWAGVVYPFLERNGWADDVGAFLATVSKPFNPYVTWEMNPVKCPVNSYEIYFLTMLITLLLYCVVSYLTCKEPFNLNRMLHRGMYAVDGEIKSKILWSPRTFFANLIGITPDYSKGDRIIAKGLFIYSFVYQFVLMFLTVVIWNAISPWPVKWWSYYFFLIYMVVPTLVAAFSAVWFGIGGVVDLRQLFVDLAARKTINELDNGVVDGHVSLADKATLDAVDQSKKS